MKYLPYYLNKMSYLNTDNQKLRKYMIKKNIFKKSRVFKIRKKFTLIKHLDNYYNKNIIIIQSYYRAYTDRKKFVNLLSKKFNNTTNFLGTKYANIPKIFRFHIDKYFFDIRELNIYIKDKKKHPYTNVLFTDIEFNNIQKKINDLLTNGYNLSISPTENINVTYSIMVTEFCSRLYELGCYPDILSFRKYSYYELLTYLKYVKKFLIISDHISLNKYDKIVKSYNKYYRKYNNDVFIQSKPNDSVKIHSFLRKIIHLLLNLINLDDDDDIRAIIFSDSIKKNILREYNEKSYESYQYNIIDYDYESDLEERGDDYDTEISNLISYCDEEIEMEIDDEINYLQNEIEF